jgi:hypothetical protein
MKTSTKPLKKTALQPLAKGQLWQINDRHMEIVEMGKTLTHYRLYAGLKQKGVPVKLGRVEEVQEYLRVNKAKLVKNGTAIALN